MFKGTPLGSVRPDGCVPPLSQLSQVFPHSWSEELVNVQMLQRPRGSSRPDGSLRCRRARCGVGARRAGRPGGGASPEAQVSQSDISLQNPDPPRSEGTLKTVVFPGRRSVSEAARPEGDTFAPGAGGAALLQRRARGGVRNRPGQRGRGEWPASDPRSPCWWGHGLAGETPQGCAASGGPEGTAC